MENKLYRICNHCNMSIEIRNPSGYCDHLYYPENCSYCNESYHSTSTSKVLPSENFKKHGLGIPPPQPLYSREEWAAIYLKVPTSGTDWIDKMINISRMDDFANALVNGINANPVATRLIKIKEVFELANELANYSHHSTDRQKDGE